MFSALLYLQFQQTRNRLAARLRRLRQPKYLVGALVGGLYLYLNFFRFLALGNHRGRRVAAGTALATALGLSAAAWLATLENAGALFLLVLSLMGWILPKGRAALLFTEAEIAFLFPAPIPRRTLVQFRLLRSQLGILFSILLLTLITGRFRGANGAFGIVQPVVGWWVILSTAGLHALALSFARSLLLERGVSNARRRTFTLAAVALVLGGTLVWARHALPTQALATAFDAFLKSSDPRAALFDVLQAANALLDAPPLGWLLWPFKLPLRPFLAPDVPAFLRALGPALGLLALHYLFILRADVAFEEASVEASRALASRLQSAEQRGGGSRRSPAAYRRRRDPFPLQPGGVRAVALLWKNLLAAGGLFSARALVVGTTVLLIAFVSLQSVANHSGNRGFIPIVGLLAVEFLSMTVLFGSQMVRNDLRQDYANADLLKTYPLPGWQIVLGELLAPTLLLTLLQWALLAVAVGCFLVGGFGGAGGGAPAASHGGWMPWSVAPRLRFALAAALIAPPFNLLSLAVPNAAVLYLPGWFQRGPQAPQGVEVMGQRLIFFFGQFFVLIVALAPAVIVGAAVYFAGKILGVGESWSLLLAALATALLLVGEVVVALFPLGRCFEQLDLAADGKN
ncbi:MAG: hypothetical protein JO295_05660 [Verrucomicrobia bacterium]|nr:hypothetical protein [Verrucomicrobiota bacterium]